MILKDGQVRLARMSDAGTIARMSRELIEYGLPWTWQPERVIRSIAQPDTNCVVSVLDKHLVAFALAEFAEHHAHMNLFAVSPDSQRKQVGTHLIEWQEKVAVTAGIRVFNLEVRANNSAALQFYNSVGFRETQLLKGYYSNREHAIRMVHHL